jgi:hypothetical protein
MSLLNVLVCILITNPFQCWQILKADKIITYKTHQSAQNQKDAAIYYVK